MSTLTLALVTIVVVVAIMVATRPAPRRNRRSERTTGVDKNAPDPLSARPTAAILDLTPATTLDAVHRNRWDRRDLAVAVGRDDQASDPALLLWPKNRCCWLAA